ncbi:glycosyltransferase family A protein [Rhizobium leguminosarum]|uniref:glycosyltransferase family A protein n=1 Tax=Rhizobium leguminosarum TaxID=384 RepID=UPI0039182120
MLWAACNGRPPFRTVVIPAFNASRYIERTLRSAGRQTYQNLEIIVVNDGSGWLRFARAADQKKEPRRNGAIWKGRIVQEGRDGGRPRDWGHLYDPFGQTTIDRKGSCALPHQCLD